MKLYRTDVHHKYCQHYLSISPVTWLSFVMDLILTTTLQHFFYNHDLLNIIFICVFLLIISAGYVSANCPDNKTVIVQAFNF